MGYMNTDPVRNGEYRFLAEWANRHRMKTGRRPVVFDIGANEGDFTAQVLALFNDVEVHCFEPNPLTFARLKARFGNESRVVLNHCGLGAEAGQESYTIAWAHRALAMLLFWKRHLSIYIPRQQHLSRCR
jgi:hypothetical protein